MVEASATVVPTQPVQPAKAEAQAAEIETQAATVEVHPGWDPAS